MKLSRNSLLLYAVTDRTWLNGRALAEQVEEALRGGATILQLREKSLDYSSFLEEAIRLTEVCGRYGVPFIVNDNVEIALACGADGVHVGQGDMQATEVRERIGEGKILGVSVATAEQAIAAYRSGADYLGAGAVFPTGSKDDADYVSPDTLREICAAVPIPVVAIGGISASNIDKLNGTGIAGVSVISAIFGQKDTEAAAKTLLERAAAL